MDTSSHETFLRRTLELARLGSEAGAGGPFGAVIVKDGEVIAESWNTVLATHDPTAHAEVNALRAACARLGTFHLEGCILYASCEPCPMCLAAAYWARVERIVFANRREDAAAIGFSDAELYRELTLPLEARTIPTERVELPDALAPMRNWLDNPKRELY